MYMNENFGAWQLNGDETKGEVQFKIFFPDRTRDSSQYHEKKDKEGNLLRDYGDPQIRTIQVVGDFQEKLGKKTWDPGSAPFMEKRPHSKGGEWVWKTPEALPAGFYEYKYYVTFNNGRTRWVGDPCCRYGGRRDQNAAVVVGGSDPDAIPLPLGRRKHLRDLIQYELHLDDFTAGYRGADAPIKAVIDKLPYLQQLGVNAIAVMPWTAWPSEGYSWGYTPYLYFSVEQYLTEHLNSQDARDPVVSPAAERLSWLKKLISECHKIGMHVIMDGVFNHVGCGDFDPGRDSGDGFPYPWFYQNPDNCPYLGQYGGCFSCLRDLDYNNGCTQEFIRDVCFYWIDEFCVDGIRFDNTMNFYIEGDQTHGLPRLIADINDRVASKGLNPFTTILEHIDISAASVANRTGASSYWNDALYQCTFDYLWNGRINTNLLNALNTHRGLNGSDKAATTYISNHDHSHATWQCGAKNNTGSMQWYRVQPYLIALFTAPGSPLIQSGTEFGQDHWIVNDDQNSGRRVRFRPLQWEMVNDPIGAQLIQLHRKLISIRLEHSSLRSDNFFPGKEALASPYFTSQGYGVNVDKQVAIYHRWGVGIAGVLERFIIVLNFSDVDQWVDIPFSGNGRWEDLLNNQSDVVFGFRLTGQRICSNWGRIYYRFDVG